MWENRCVSLLQSECQSLPKGDLSSGSSSSNLFPKVAVFGAMRLGFPSGYDAEVASTKDQGIVRTPHATFECDMALEERGKILMLLLGAG